jgi:oligopeptide/dipeptide ABC transporter ATP-binding protein
MSFIPMKNNNLNIIEIEDLKVYFPVHQHLLRNLFQREREYIRAVDGISFSIKRGETFGLVGESGSGKTTLGRTLTLMVKPTSGKILLDGKNVLEGGIKEHEKEVRKKIQMVFQDPFSSLNPRKTVKHAIEVPLQRQYRKSKKEVEEKLIGLLELTGLHASTRLMYPHELSGGQRQRVVIARALAADPRFLIADEPVSKLDLSIKAQIINLFGDLQKKMGLTMMFIAHDLRMAKHVSDTIAVMYHGHLMEIADSRELFRNPVHPYTKALLEAIPTLNPEHRKRLGCGELKVQEVSLINPPLGCRYFKSCLLAKRECEDSPVTLEKMEERHWVACHRVR